MCGGLMQVVCYVRTKVLSFHRLAHFMGNNFCRNRSFFKINIRMNKKERIFFRVTKDEKLEIKRLAKVLGYDSISDYLSTIATSGMSKKQQVAIYFQLNYMRVRNAQVENNINQIARHLNTHKAMSITHTDEFFKLWNEFINIRQEQNQILQTFITKVLEDKKKLYSLLNKLENES